MVSCQDCRFWVKDEDLEAGECRRHAPHADKDPDITHVVVNEIKSPWNLTLPYWGCGEGEIEDEVEDEEDEDEVTNERT